MADEMNQYIKIEKDKARRVGKFISDEEARRRAEARRKGFAINLVTGEMIPPGVNPMQNNSMPTPSRGQQADAERYQTMTQMPASYWDKWAEARRPVSGTGFPSTTADSAERRQQGAISGNARPASVRPNLFPSGVLPISYVSPNQQTTTPPAYPNQNLKRSYDYVYDEYIRQGYDPQSAAELASIATSNKYSTEQEKTDAWYNSKVYKENFGWINEQRKQINPSSQDMTSSEIISYFNSVKDFARRAGLPSNFWDNDTFAKKAAANDMSLYEVSDRIKIAADFANNQDPYFKAAAKEMGVLQSDIVGIILDPELGIAAAERNYRATTLLGEIRRANLGVDKEVALELESANITQEQARQASAQVARQTGTLGTLSAIEGAEAITEEEQLTGRLGLNVEAEARAQGLRSRERARFGGTSAGTRMFGRSVSGNI